MVSQISAGTNDSSCLASAAHFPSSSQFKSPLCFTCICVAMQWFGVGNGTLCSCWVPVTLINLIRLLVQFHGGACELQGGASGGMWLNPWGQPSFGVFPPAEATAKCWWDFLLLECEEFTSGWYRHKQVIIQLDHCTAGHTVTHVECFYLKDSYFSGWHLLCLTLNSSNFHGIHIHCGFSVEFLILTFYCLCT